MIVASPWRLVLLVKIPLVTDYSIIQRLVMLIELVFCIHPGILVCQVGEEGVPLATLLLHSIRLPV